ncbi:PLP-dependent transferase [Candidatus Bathyarchaeota archaeon]|nr:PLP-dependent transferase [Candidatus Bathyarchaeota archaeon]MBS7635958.1 PLP-dependent transferase [Candidatus Bathyarchaeota archaeon]
MASRRTGFSTRAVHGREKPDALGAVATQIYETSAFAFTSAKEPIDVVSGKAEGYLYTRFDNPTVRAVERKMALLEGLEDAAAFASGMAAITTTILTMVSKGDHVVASRDLYGGTLTFFQEVLPRFRVEVTFIDATNIGKMETTINKNTRLVYAGIVCGSEEFIQKLKTTRKIFGRNHRPDGCLASVARFKDSCFKNGMAQPKRNANSKIPGKTSKSRQSLLSWFAESPATQSSQKTDAGLRRSGKLRN